MHRDDATEPLEWNSQQLRRSLDEWAVISSQMIDLLHDTVGSERSRNWQPHLAQIVKAIRAFSDRCRTEAQGLGGWREDGLDPDDVFDAVRGQGQRLVEWLQRMIPE